MHFTRLTDTEFTLLFSGAVFLAVIFYLISFRRSIAVLSTEPIWRRVLGRRRTPFRKLLALLLQILVLFLLSLAAASPMASSEPGAKPVAMVLIIDTSASMNARDGRTSRMDRAIELFEKITDALGPRDRLLPTTMDSQCRPLTAWSGKKKTLRRATENIEASFVPEDFSPCIDFAQRALDSDAFGSGFEKKIAVLSDRFHPVAEDTRYPVTQTSVGAPLDNLAVTAFEIRLRGGASGGYELFVQVKNFGSIDRRVTLSIHTNKSLLGEELVDVPAHGSTDRSYFLKQVQETEIMASISSATHGPADGFSLDDRAYALLPSRQRPKVLLVSGGNLYLEKALQLDSSIDVQIVKPEAFSQSMADEAQALVFDGPCIKVQKPAIYFSPRSEQACPFQVSDEVQFPDLLPANEDHPVTRGVTLVDVRIDLARHLIPERGDVELMQDKDGPLVLARQQGGEKTLAFGFDIANSDLPLRIAFPILVHNCISWLLGEHEDPGALAYTAGSTLWLPGPQGRPSKITGPDGMVYHPLRLGARYAFRPPGPGFYDLVSPGSSWKFAVDFDRPDESSFSYDKPAGVAQSTWRGGQVPKSLIAGLDATPPKRAPEQWPTVLLAAAWLLLFDWVFFCFRILF